MSTLAEANRRYFDSISGSYDSKPWFATVNNQVTDFFRSNLDWLGIPLANTGSSSDVAEVRLLDYASGTGLMTRTLGPYVTTTRGIDISPNMVSAYNTRMSSASLSPAFSASHGDLLDKSDAAPSAFAGAEFRDFDIATVGFGFHHFEDVVHAARQLKLRLRPGGVLVINDFLEGGDLLADEHGAQVQGTEGNHAVHTHGHGQGHGGRHGEGHAHAQGQEHDHEHKHHHHHHHHQGEEAKHDVNDATAEFKKKMNDSIVVPHFTIEGVKDFFTAAGFVDVDVVTLGERSYMEFAGKKVWRTILFARGRRPVDEGKSEL